MPTLSVNGIIGERGSSLSTTATKIRTTTGKLQSLLGVKPQTLIIGALEKEGSNIFTRATDQLWGNITSLASPLGEKLSKEYKQDGVKVDAIMEYDGDISVAITKNPVQKSADINDTRIKQPITLQIELGVSNDVVSDIVGQTKKIVAGVAALAGYDLYDRRILTFNKFKQLLYEGKPFKIITPHGEYENMLLVRIKPRTTEETQGLFYGTLYFQQVITFEEMKNNFTQPQGSTFAQLEGLAKGMGVDTSGIKSLASRISSWL